MKVSIILSLLLMLNTNSGTEKYLFYLHGKIVEDQGAKAVSPAFGVYQYQEILDAFKKEHFNVLSELRKKNTDVQEYALHVSEEIDSLLKKGVAPQNITVVGASKGAVIAMYVSTFLKNKNINYVFLAACNDGNFESFPDINFYGNILSIYEKSDNIGESCTRFRNKSSATISHYKEVAINTGLQHGFLFQPLPQWMNPAVKWANGDYE